MLIFHAKLNGREKLSSGKFTRGVRANIGESLQYSLVLALKVQKYYFDPFDTHEVYICTCVYESVSFLFEVFTVAFRIRRKTYFSFFE